MAVRTVSETVFACYSRACRPPTSGGTGGSSPSGAKGKGHKRDRLVQQITAQRAKAARKQGAPTSAGPDWGVRNSGSRVGWRAGRYASGKERLEKNGRVHVVQPVGSGQYKMWKLTTTKNGKELASSHHTTKSQAQLHAEKQ